MKKLHVLALLVLFICVFASCSNDDEPSNSEVLGKWICVETNDFVPIIENPYDCYFDFHVGDGIVFFEGEFTSKDNLISGKKCFILDDGQVYIVNDEVYKSNPTEYDWNKNVLYNSYEDDYSFDQIYILDGTLLTIILEGDLDRVVGTISIDGDILTYTYNYQDWGSGTQLIRNEYGPFVAKFKKQ